MTEQIKSAIKTFNQLLFLGKVYLPKEEIESNIKTAIRSLKAWEEVIKGLEQRVKTFSKMCDKDPCMHYEDMEFAYMNCINIINQHFAEIEEKENEQ